MINNIQALRAFAALNVVFMHIIGAASVFGPPVEALMFLKGWGRSGVDVFFVISGFVMVYTQQMNPKSASAFLTNRVVRIVPVYWFLTLFMFALYLALPAMFNDDADFSLAFLSQSLLFVTAPFGRSPIIYVGWTLELEMLFYIVFAVSLLLRNRRLGVLLCAMALLLVAFAGQTLPLEFLMGMGCAWVFLRYPAAKLGWLMPAGALLLLSSLLMSPDRIEPMRVVIWGVPSVLLVLGSCYLPQTRSSLALALGAASYSIYLGQVFTISAFYKVAPRLLGSLGGPIVALICFFLTALFGYLLYATVERNLARALKRRPRSALPPPRISL